ncbi:MAG: hypothetical protein KC636_04410 [Myxococcales bacterium]|nr:hypothetical protein [Myxococcales bacterium]
MPTARAHHLLLLAASMTALACAATPAPVADAPQEAPPPAEAQATSPAPAASSTPRVVVDDGGRELFRARDVEGAFVLLDATTGERVEVAPERAGIGEPPASTFKIPNTLIGLTTGVIPDADFALKWDGTPRQIAAWNRDHDLRSAMKHSVVWFYQEVARRIGEARMAAWVARLEYGNADISGGVDRFWLDGALRISAREQVEFLRRLHARELPVTREHAALVEELIELERGPGWVLRGKTGLTEQGDRTVGWLVGILEEGERSYLYATLVLAGAEDLERVIPLRAALTRALLQRHGHPLASTG